jgi:hypothetical protein
MTTGTKTLRAQITSIANRMREEVRIRREPPQMVETTTGSALEIWAEEIEMALQQTAEGVACEMCDKEITNNTFICTNCWNRVAQKQSFTPQEPPR